MKTIAVIPVLLTSVLATPYSQRSPPPSLRGKDGRISKEMGKYAQDMIRRSGAVPPGPAPKGCSLFEIIVARGTGEGGPFGVIVGDPLVKKVTQQLPGSRGYAVQYPASTNFSVSSLQGVDDVINRLNKQSKECPNQKFSLVGYSQGAGVIHGALASSGKPYPGGPSVRPKLDKAAIPKIASIVLFGDPGFKPGPGPTGTTIPPIPAALLPKLRNNCHQKDPACDPAGGGFENHLEYINDPWQKDSVAYIIAGFKGLPLPNAPKTIADAEWIKKPNV